MGKKLTPGGEDLSRMTAYGCSDDAERSQSGYVRRGILIAGLVLLFTVQVAWGRQSPRVVVPDTVDWHRYFPLQVGNIWEFEDGEGFPLTRLEITADSVVGNRSYYHAVESIFGVFWPNTDLALFQRNEYDLRYDSSGLVFWLPDILADTTDTPVNYRLGMTEFPQINLRSSFGDSVSIGPGAYDICLIGGGFEQTISIASQTVVSDATKRFNCGVGMWYSYATDIGLVRTDKMTMGGPRLRYAEVNGVEYGSRLIHVSAQSPPETSAATTIKSVYPNPAADVATVEISVEKAGVLHIHVYDAIGRRVRSTIFFSRVGTSRHTLDLRSLPPGAYLIRAEDSGGRSYSYRITVAR